MNFLNSSFGSVWLILALLCALEFSARAYEVPEKEEPRWLTLKPPKTYVDLLIEDETETQTLANGSQFSRDRIYFAPTLGLNLRGSVYHPNFLEFNLEGQGGYVRQDESEHTKGAPALRRTDESFLQSYNFNALFLREKPYAATFYANKSHSIQQLDIFNSVTVDTQGYGARLDYKEGPVPMSLNVRHIDQEQSDLNFRNSNEQNVLEYKASYEHGRGGTDLTYNFGQFSRRTSDGIKFSDQQINQNISLGDSERFGKHDQMSLTSAFYFNADDSTNFPSQNIMLQENFTVKHTPTLDSFYNYNFSDFSIGPIETRSHFASAALRHQLYDSLTSVFDINGGWTDTASINDASNIRTIGIGDSENYVKHLGAWGNLTLGNGIRFQHESHEGDVHQIPREPHTIIDGNPEFLKQPNVTGVDDVSSPDDTKHYLRGIDYDLRTHGALTEIYIPITNTNGVRTLKFGDPIVVTYTIHPQGSGSSSSLGDQVRIRLDLWNGRLGFYSNLGWIKNFTSGNIVVENAFSTQSGVDYSWRWLRLGAEYETRDSNFISYEAKNFYQSLMFHPGVATTLSFDTRERWINYSSGVRQTVQDYSFVTRFHERLTGHLDYSLEGGIRSQQGGFLEQTMAAARAELNYSIGKLSLSVNYQFNDNETSGNVVDKHFFSFHVRRSF